MYRKIYDDEEVFTMRKLLPILLLIISICVVTGYAQIREDVWALIPASSKAHIEVRGYGGNRELSIKCFFNTVEILRTVTPGAAMETINSLVSIINERLGGRALMVYVAPYGSQYFWPTSFKFTQVLRQFSLSFSDVMTLRTGSAFSGGQLLDGTVTNGCIAVPAGIDVTKPFKIWYDDDYAQLGPFLLAQSQTTSTGQVPYPKTLFLRLTNLDTTVSPGDVAIVRAETLPQADCTIIVYYKSGVCESSGLQPQEADENGIVHWAWRIDPDLEPGIVLK
jgi:hypothetical protein